MIILFGKKFTASNLDTLIKQHWQNALNANKAEKIVFDLKEIEWIALAELTLLFAWIRHLISLDKQIYIELPTVQTVSDRKLRRLISLFYRWHIAAFVPINRATGLKDIERYFNITPELESVMERQVKGSKFRERYEDKTWHRIIPFCTFKAEYTFPKDNLREIIRAELEDVFKLEKQIETLLNVETAYSPFENKTLSHIITTELFLNVIHHSFPKDYQGKRQCYMAAVLSNKMDSEKFRERNSEAGKTLTSKQAFNEVQEIIRRNYEDERPEEERLFFRSKRDTSIYINASYIEFTFLDFGVGIPSTLRKQYQDDIRNEQITSQLSVNHNMTCEDSRVLEYAFLLHSSRLPFDQNIEIQAYVPRGLFFLVDIVRRYAGMVIARSNEGKVVFDFSDNSQDIHSCVRFSANKQTLPFFQGTMITIILPANKEGILLNAVQHKIPRAKGRARVPFKYLSIATLIGEARQNLSDISSQNQLYNHLFKSLNNRLQAFNSSPSIVLLDFAGCDNSVIDQKIYYYLCNTPYINEHSPAIILNPHDKKILVNVQKSIMSSPVFLFRPIPCIFSSNREIIWIGIKNPEDVENLNKLLIYSKEPAYNLATSDFRDPLCLLGNVIQIDWVDNTHFSGNISLATPCLDEISKYYVSEIVPRKFILDLIENPNDNVRLNSENEVYWTSSGYYQKEFISFMDKLYHVSTSDQISEVFGRQAAQYLINKLVEKLDIGSKLENQEMPKIDKIIAVTLSSQLLARYVRDIYSQIKNISRENEKPELIKMANYYDFTSEKTFRKIQADENVLIVHDVIATGALNKRIYDSLTKDSTRKANIIATLSLLDTRNYSSISVDGDIANKEIEGLFIYLAYYPVEKFRYNPIPGSSVIAINPVLNTPSKMQLKMSETYKVIFCDTERHAIDNKSTQDFINRIDDKFLWVGHLHHHAAHHSYFIKTVHLFQDENGKGLLKELFKSMSEREEVLDEAKKYNAIEKLWDDLKEIEIVLEESDKAIVKELKLINNKLASLDKKLHQKKFNFDSSKIDYIFYPIYSGTEAISNKELADFLDVKIDSFILFPLPRIDTPKGWRFTFPPDTLNKPIKDKKVLIIDDGSCTGETLLQMIDTISFLKVSKITVFSIIARLEDFQREFFSRIHQIRADYIKEETNSHKIKIRMVPIEIFFGVNLHIPNYSARSSCPFCDEKHLLTNIKKQSPSPPNSVIKYLTYRLRALQEYDTEGVPLSDQYDIKDNIYRGIPYYWPADIDLKKAYLFRDKLGKLETYRLFSDYLNDFQQLKFTEKTFEIFTAVLLHEPHLMNSINQFLPELKLELSNFISRIIYSTDGMQNIRNRWEKAELLRFYYIVDSLKFYQVESLNKIFSYAEDNERALDYLAYILWDEVVSKKNVKSSRGDLAFLIDDVRSTLQASGKQKTYGWNILKEIYKTYDIQKNSLEFEKSFNNVMHFFNKESILTTNHSQVEKDLIDLVALLNYEETTFASSEFTKEYRALMSDIRGVIDVFIESFNGDDFLKRNFPRLYSTFFEADNSVGQLFARLDRDFALIEGLIKSRNASLQDCMLRLRESLIVLKDDIISPTGNFAELVVKNKRVDFISTWITVKERMATKLNARNITIDDSKMLIKNAQYVFIFKDCLKVLFEELINNALKNENMKCTCNIIKDEGMFVFMIEQNRAFPIDYREHIGIPLIRETAEKFGGRFHMDNLNSTPRFELRLLDRT